MQTQSERGIALVLALFLMSALSILGASLMFLSQSETYASMNYRMMSQARYAAEAGVNKSANFLLDGVQYTVPTVGPSADQVSNYITTVSPVTTLDGHPVVLAAGTFTGVTANYPVPAVQTAFSAAAQGTIAAGTGTLTYKAYATLVSMQKIEAYGGTQDVVQTWEVTADGGVGSSKATVRVTATAERPKVSANSYAAFATSNLCDALDFQGNASTDSYDSSVGPPAVSTETTGGDVGTNGNLHVQGHANVGGNLYVPRDGVGACTEGATGASTGLTGTVCDHVVDPTCINGSVDNMVKLPKAVIFPVPTFPPSATPGTGTLTVNAALLGNTVATATATCTSLGLTLGTPPAGNCDLKTAAGDSAAAGTAGAYTQLVVGGTGADIALPNVTVPSGFELVINGSSAPSQKVNINSLNVDGDLTFAYTNNDASVIMQFAGKNADGTEMTTPVFNLSDLSSWKQNKPTGTNYDASALQIVYGGTQPISMQGGNSQSAATIYAPNATFELKGTQDFFGSVLAKTVTDKGNNTIHYDRRLQRQFWVAGQPMMGTFSWQRAQ